VVIYIYHLATYPLPLFRGGEGEGKRAGFSRRCYFLTSRLFNPLFYLIVTLQTMPSFKVTFWAEANFTFLWVVCNKVTYFWVAPFTQVLWFFEVRFITTKEFRRQPTPRSTYCCYEVVFNFSHCILTYSMVYLLLFITLPHLLQQ